MNIDISLEKISGLIGHYNLNENPATNNTEIVDISSEGNNGILKTNDTDEKSVAGKINNAIYFDGVGDYIDIEKTIISAGSHFTISYWIKLPTLSQPQAFSNIIGQQGGNVWFFYVNSGNNFYIRVDNDITSVQLNLGVAEVDTWYHIVGTYDDETVKGYVNGSLVNSGEIEGPLKSPGASDFAIGANYNGANPINASIDDVRVYDRALTDSEIESIYNEGDGTETHGIPRTKDILLDSLKKKDIINREKDELYFSVLKYGDEGFIPEINQEVEMNIDGIKEFGGVIVEVNKSIQSGQVVRYDVVCSDYTQYLDRKLVLERYDDTSVLSIIEDVIGEYTDGFTTNNVEGSGIEVETMTFNRVTVAAALDKIARTINYSWYVDYDKDIHFFPRSQNPAPFKITDTNGNYIQNTLEIKDDLTQLRNTVVIRGAEERGEERTEEYEADGEQVQFPLANKYATLPAVDVNSTSQIVGTDYLTEEDDADCFWSYGEKYIRFKDSTKPNDGEVVKVTGIPLFPIIVKVLDGESIEEYGTYEFFKEDKSIKSRDEALDYANAELEAYKDGVIEGGFATDQSGLRSGQIITISSDMLGIDEDFLIQKVGFRMISKERGEWTVELATMRTIGIIQVLQDLIAFREIREYDPDNLLELIQLDDGGTAKDVLQASDEWTITNPPYLWVADDGGTTTSSIRWNFFTWSEAE